MRDVEGTYDCSCSVALVSGHFCNKFLANVGDTQDTYIRIMKHWKICRFMNDENRIQRKIIFCVNQLDDDALVFDAQTIMVNEIYSLVFVVCSEL